MGEARLQSANIKGFTLHLTGDILEALAPTLSTTFWLLILPCPEPRGVRKSRPFLVRERSRFYQRDRVPSEKTLREGRKPELEVSSMFLP
jgi:hypothetical protein